MYWLIALMTLSLLGIIGLGLYLELGPLTKRMSARPWFKRTVGVNLLVFLAILGGLVLVAIQEVAAQPIWVEATKEISLGMALTMLAIGLPTAVAVVAAAWAVSTVGAASLAVIAEKPESFGRTLVYLGLAEGIAIYGLLATILMLEKI